MDFFQNQGVKLSNPGKLVIERQGDELRIRPARRRMGDVLGKLAQFSPDFMSEGRGLNVAGEREALSGFSLVSN